MTWLQKIAQAPTRMLAYRAEGAMRGVMTDAMPEGIYFFPSREQAELWSGGQGKVTGQIIDTSNASVQDVPEGEMNRLQGGQLSNVIIRRDPDGSGQILEIVVFDSSLIAGEVEYTTECTGHHHGQTDCQIVARMGGEWVGYLPFSIFEGEILIQHVKVDESLRRQGIATAMYRELEAVAKEDGLEIRHSSTTPDGAGWRESL